MVDRSILERIGRTPTDTVERLSHHDGLGSKSESVEYNLDQSNIAWRLSRREKSTGETEWSSTKLPVFPTVERDPSVPDWTSIGDVRSPDESWRLGRFDPICRTCSRLRTCHSSLSRTRRLRESLEYTRTVGRLSSLLTSLRSIAFLDGEQITV